MSDVAPGAVVQVHQRRMIHPVCREGRVCAKVYYDSGSLQERHAQRFGGPCPGIQVPRGVYHTCRCLEPGSVIVEAKDRPYDPERTEDLFGE